MTEALSPVVAVVVSCRKGGRVGVVGAYVGYMNHFNFGALMEKGLALKAGQTPVQVPFYFSE